MNFQRKKLGEILVEAGAITPAEVDLIRAQQPLHGKRFGETGVAEGFFSEDLLA